MIVVGRMKKILCKFDEAVGIYRLIDVKREVVEPRLIQEQNCLHKTPIKPNRYTYSFDN